MATPTRSGCWTYPRATCARRGMSRPKAGYLHGVAAFWLEHKLIDRDWSELTDQEIIDLLTLIRGVGQWTVEMVLMFVLRRPDLLPAG